MPTFDVTMCGVLGDERQNIERELGAGADRLTAFAIPFMTGKHLYLELEGQGMVAIVRRVRFGLWYLGWRLFRCCAMSEFLTLTGYYRFLFLYLEPCKQARAGTRIVLMELQSPQSIPRFTSLSIQEHGHSTMI